MEPDALSRNQALAAAPWQTALAWLQADLRRLRLRSSSRDPGSPPKSMYPVCAKVKTEPEMGFQESLPNSILEGVGMARSEKKVLKTTGGNMRSAFVFARGHR